MRKSAAHNEVHGFLATIKQDYTKTCSLLQLAFCCATKLTRKGLSVFTVTLFLLYFMLVELTFAFFLFLLPYLFIHSSCFNLFHCLLLHFLPSFSSFRMLQESRKRKYDEITSTFFLLAFLFPFTSGSQFLRRLLNFVSSSLSHVVNCWQFLCSRVRIIL